MEILSDVLLGVFAELAHVQFKFRFLMCTPTLTHEKEKVKKLSSLQKNYSDSHEESSVYIKAVITFISPCAHRAPAHVSRYVKERFIHIPLRMGCKNPFFLEM